VTPSGYIKQNGGEPGKLQDGVPVIMRAIEPMLCREASGGTREYF